ncbi:MAG: hypothetical protein SAJ12_15990 [Jaaginema sp. PMC 1079.18]|nr:hypothetical protein [Jaaginema sp. PMC 1079.18]MEC4865507.1 hypothetical protein [Jaaginema sp. PMC 1078.18]
MSNLCTPLTLGAIALFPAVAQSQIIIINPSPVITQPQSATYIYGSPIATPIPVNPVTGKPTIFDRNPNLIVQPQPQIIVTPQPRRVYRNNTIIVNPNGQYYYPNPYPVNQNSYFYYDSSGNIQLQIRR